MTWDGNNNSCLTITIPNINSSKSMCVTNYDIDYSVTTINSYLMELESSLSQLYIIPDPDQREEVRRKLEIAKSLAKMVNFLLLREMGRTQIEKMLP